MSNPTSAEELQTRSVDVARMADVRAGAKTARLDLDHLIVEFPDFSHRLSYDFAGIGKAAGK